MLEEGLYTLSFEKENDSSVDGKVEIVVKEDKNYKYKIHCTSDQIEIDILSGYTTSVSANEFLGKSVDDVKKELKDSGFKNIKTKEIKDLSFDDKELEYCVSNVFINGKKDFSATDEFDKDVEIIIEYHLFKEIVMPLDSEDYTNKNIEDVKSEIQSLGFANIEVIENNTYNKAIVDGNVCSISVDGDNFSKEDSFLPNAKVTIVCYKKLDSEYDIAFVKKSSDYSLFYLFDMDANTVVHFNTSDTYLDKGTFSGELSNGITINWNHGQWTDKVIYKSDSSNATLIDGNGFEWEFNECNLDEAIPPLNKLQSNN